VISADFGFMNRIKLDVDGAWPAQCGEMVIVDITRRKYEGLRVQVTESGASGSPLQLFAKDVTDLDASA
jgi:hypothetical protein